MQNLVGYFDASGHHAGSTNVTVAGWISSPEGWRAFEQRWADALADLGLSTFHTSEFAHHLKSYAHWSEPQRRIRFGRLAELITEHTLASVAIGVPMQDFEREFSPQARAHAGGPFGFASTVLFMEAPLFVTEHLKPEATEFRLDYVFESGDPGRGQVDKLFKANSLDERQVEKLHLGSLTFAAKRDFGALQAADILAYELYQHFPRQLGMDPRPPRRYNLNQLAANRAWDWRYMTRERMREDWAKVIDLSAQIAEVEGWPRKPLPDDWTWPEQRSPAKPTINLAIKPKKRRSRRGG